MKRAAAAATVDMGWHRTPALDTADKYTWITAGKVVQVNQTTGEVTITDPKEGPA